MRIPTLDATLPAMCTADSAKSSAALQQLRDESRFAAPYGPRFVVASEPTYNPVQYWRGPAWPQLNYLAALAARRCGDDALADELGRTHEAFVLARRVRGVLERGDGSGARGEASVMGGGSCCNVAAAVAAAM